MWYNINVNEIKEITIMITYTKVTTRNVTALAKRTNGNLYFRDRDARTLAAVSKPDTFKVVTVRCRT